MPLTGAMPPAAAARLLDVGASPALARLSVTMLVADSAPDP